MIRFDPFDDNGVWVNNGHIMLDPQHLSKGVAYAREHRCTHIGIYDFIRARHHVDLSFLLEMPYVRSFQLDCGLADSVDLTPLYHLPRLCSLHICGQVKEVDLSRFPCLKRLECLFQPGVMFSSTTITSLKVAGAPRLDFLSGLPNVTTIQLTYYKGSDVHGVRCASRLRDFTAHSARNLVDVSELQQCAYLRSVDLEGVPRRLNYNVLGECPNLGSLYLDGVIPSCEFVSKLKNLWAFSCREIANDDLSPLMKSSSLSSVCLSRYKRTYNYSQHDVETRFGWHD